MPKKILPPGTLPLVVGSLLFITVGIIVCINPTSFFMNEGSAPYGAPSGTSYFSEKESQAFGFVFILLGFLIGYFAYRFARSI